MRIDPAPTVSAASPETARLADLDHAHVWHPFTPMRQWLQQPPLIIERGDGPYLFDTDGKRYIDGVSSLWCNVHGHRVPHVDQAIRDQLDKIAHTTMLGLASPPSIELAKRLVDLTTSHVPDASLAAQASPLTKVFYSDAGATALEVAFKMAVGYWHHNGKPEKTRFIGLEGAYHGDTVGSMSVGYSDLFHKPFHSMTFPVDWFPSPDPLRPPADLDRTGRYCDTPAAGQSMRKAWPSEDPALAAALTNHCLGKLREMLERQADQTAAIVIEPVMQGAAGMICQPPGFLRGVASLARHYNVLLICDEVATGFCRTGHLFAYQSELTPPPKPDLSDREGPDADPAPLLNPDILCLAKGLTAGYLPLAATLTTQAVFDAFTGEPHERKTLYHGHTYTGNPLACAAALACIDLVMGDGECPMANGSANNNPHPNHPPSAIRHPPFLQHTRDAAALIREHLHPLRDCPLVADIRQRGLMVGIELHDAPVNNTASLDSNIPDTPSASPPSPPTPDPKPHQPFNFAAPLGHQICHALRDEGIIIRPLGNVLVLMPIPATDLDTLTTLVDAVVNKLLHWSAA